MEKMTLTDARKRFPDMIRRAEYLGERAVITRHGREVAAIVSMDDLAFLTAHGKEAHGKTGKRKAE